MSDRNLFLTKAMGFCLKGGEAKFDGYHCDSCGKVYNTVNELLAHQIFLVNFGIGHNSKSG